MLINVENFMSKQLFENYLASILVVPKSIEKFHVIHLILFNMSSEPHLTCELVIGVFMYRCKIFSLNLDQLLGILNRYFH